MGAVFDCIGNVTAFSDEITPPNARERSQRANGSGAIETRGDDAAQSTGRRVAMARPCG
jgi:hypothetical protein